MTPQDACELHEVALALESASARLVTTLLHLCALDATDGAWDPAMAQLGSDLTAVRQALDRFATTGDRAIREVAARARRRMAE